MNLSPQKKYKKENEKEKYVTHRKGVNIFFHEDVVVAARH
jgi:hypothetical protein